MTKECTNDEIPKGCRFDPSRSKSFSARHRVDVEVQISFWKSDFPRIPTGFRNRSQGCEERATLGKGSEGQNPNGVSAPKQCVLRVATPSGLLVSAILTQGSSRLTTLGFRTQSLRDWQISKVWFAPLTLGQPENDRQGHSREIL